MKQHLKTAEWIAKLLDDQFEILGIKFGLSSFINMIPTIGDLISAGLSLYIVWIAAQMKVPTLRIYQMIWNIILSFLLGLLPFLGDAAYILRQTNLRNLKLLKQYAPTDVIEGQIISATTV